MPQERMPQDRDVVIVGAVRRTFDNSLLGRRPGVLMGFTEGDEARRTSLLSRDEREYKTAACVTRYFGAQARAHLHRYGKNELLEPRVRGGYVSQRRASFGGERRA